MSVEGWIGRLSIAVAVVCATVVTVTAVALTMPSVRSSLGLRPATPEPSYSVGQSIDLPPEVFGQTAHTVLILFRPDCGACARLKPYLTRLAARRQPSLRVVAISDESYQADAAVFVKQIGLSSVDLITTNFEKLRARTVPTVALVDQAGTIESVFEGIPTTEIEEELLRQLIALSPGR